MGVWEWAAVALLACGLTEGLIWASLPGLGPLRGLPLLDYLPRYFAAGAAYLGAVAVLALSLRRPRSLRSTRNLAGPLLILIFAGALLFRLPLLARAPTLSDDVYRYIWDGRMQNAGLNPYAFRVDDPRLDGLATPNRARVNNPEMASPYLPVAQWMFAAVYRLAPESPRAFQATALVCDLLAGIWIALALRRLGRPAEWSLVYLWNPLVVVEFAHGAHVDALMVMLMCASLLALAGRKARALCTTPGSCRAKMHPSSMPEDYAQRHKKAGSLNQAGFVAPSCLCVAESLNGHPASRSLEAPSLRPAIAEITRIIRPRVLAPAIVSAVLLALATLVKPVPALLLPALAPRWGWKGSLAYALMLGAGLALYSGAGWGLTGSLEAGTGIFGATRIYLARWNFNAGLYHWLEALATGRYSPGAAPMGIAGIEAAKAVSAAGTLAVMAGVAWKAWARRGWLDPAARPGLLLAPLAAYLLLTPTVHPWYLAPLIAVLPFCMASSAGHALTVIPWLCFSISAGLSYLTYLDPLNLRETDFARRWEYLPVYALLALQALARRPARR